MVISKECATSWPRFWSFSKTVGAPEGFADTARRTAALHNLSFRGANTRVLHGANGTTSEQLSSEKWHGFVSHESALLDSGPSIIFILFLFASSLRSRGKFDFYLKQHKYLNGRNTIVSIRYAPIDRLTVAYEASL